MGWRREGGKVGGYGLLPYPVGMMPGVYNFWFSR